MRAADSFPVRSVVSWLAALALSGCSSASCPAGTVRVGDDCIVSSDSGQADSGAPDACSPATFYEDGDGDGFGAMASAITACAAPSGYVAEGTDCDDEDAMTHPGATESCNAIDDDCDELPDDGFECVSGASAVCTTSCGSSGTGTCTSACMTASGSACTPPAETCNAIDDDCDVKIDESVVASVEGPAVGTADGSSTVRVLPGVGSQRIVVWLEGDFVRAVLVDATGVPVGEPVDVIGYARAMDAFVSGTSLVVYTHVSGNLDVSVRRTSDLGVIHGGVVVHQLNGASMAPTIAYRLRAAPVSPTTALIALYATIGTSTGITVFPSSFASPPAAETAMVPPPVSGSDPEPEFSLTSDGTSTAWLAYARSGIRVQRLTSTGAASGSALNVATGTTPAIAYRAMPPTLGLAYAGVASAAQLAVLDVTPAVLAGPIALGSSVVTTPGTTTLAISPLDVSVALERWLVAGAATGGGDLLFDASRSGTTIAAHSTPLSAATATATAGIDIDAARPGIAFAATTRAIGSVRTFRYGCDL